MGYVPCYNLNRIRRDAMASERRAATEKMVGKALGEGVSLVFGPPWLRVVVVWEDEGVFRPFRGFAACVGAAPEDGRDDVVARVFIRRGEVAGGPAEPTSWWEGDILFTEQDAGRGRYDAQTRRGEVILPGASIAFAETFLRQIFLWECYRAGAVVFHSVAFRNGKGAVLSCGESGSGKSTLASLLTAAFEVYSDEMNAVDKAGRVWAFPFRGTGVTRIRYGGFPLAALCFHFPAEEARAEPISREEAMVALWRNVFLPAAAPAGVTKDIFGRVADLAAQSNLLAIGVPLDGEAVRNFFLNRFNRA